MPVLYALMETSVAPPPTRPAGFWIRALGALIDFAVFSIVYVSQDRMAARIWGSTLEESSLLQLMVVVFTFVFMLLYTTVLHAWGGQTIGKLVVGVWVVADDGGPLPFGAALLRHFAYHLSLLTLTLGFVIAGLRQDKRALHDLIAGSRVVRSAPAPPARPATPALDAVAVAPTPAPDASPPPDGPR
jgi:uncharacterized RDD family membrane protein YckC